MGDIVDPQTRSRMMAAVGTKHTAPEMLIRRFLHAAGLRYRLHDRTLPGAPDVVLPRFKAVVLVHGCFWHQHRGCMKARLPSTNTAFWRKKLIENVRRDLRTSCRLRGRGWRVFTVWECESHNVESLNALVAEIRRGLFRSTLMPATNRSSVARC